MTFDHLEEIKMQRVLLYVCLARNIILNPLCCSICLSVYLYIRTTFLSSLFLLYTAWIYLGGTKIHRRSPYVSLVSKDCQRGYKHGLVSFLFFLFLFFFFSTQALVNLEELKRKRSVSDVCLARKICQYSMFFCLAFLYQSDFSFLTLSSSSHNLDSTWRD